MRGGSLTQQRDGGVEEKHDGEQVRGQHNGALPATPAPSTATREPAACIYMYVCTVNVVL